MALAISTLATLSIGVVQARAADDAAPAITTFAGGGVGDGGPASQASVEDPSGLAFDAAGNMYVADSGNFRLRKVAPGGRISTVAGLGRPRACELWCDVPGTFTFAFALESVDGLAARAAQIRVGDVALDPHGDLVVLEIGINAPTDCAVQRIDASGTIRTIVTDTDRQCQQFRANEPVSRQNFPPRDGPVGTATFGRLLAMAAGPDGSLYLSEWSQVNPLAFAVRRIDPAGTTVTTVVGRGASSPADGMPATEARLAPPCAAPALAVDADGLLHFASCGQIFKVDAGGTLRLVAGGGPCCARPDGVQAVGAFVGSDVKDMTFADDGSLYFSDFSFEQGGDTFRGVRRIAPDGTISTVATTSFVPGALATDPGGNLFVAATGNFFDRVYWVGEGGTLQPAAGNGLAGFYGDGGYATDAGFAYVGGITRDRAGNTYVMDSWNDMVRRIDGDSGVVTTVAGNPQDKCDFSSGNLYGDGGPAAEAGLCLAFPQGGALAADSVGNLYIADYWNARIRRVDADTGIITSIWGWRRPGAGGGPLPHGLYVDRDDNLYFSLVEEIRAERVGDGEIRRIENIRDYEPPQPLPRDNSDSSLVADLGRGTLWSMIAGGDQGRLYVTSPGRHRVYRIDPPSAGGSPAEAVPVAGSGAAGFAGDGGRATMARLRKPSGIAVDSAGNLFISDFDDHRIRRVDADTGVITTIAGDGRCCTTGAPFNFITGAYGGDGGPATSASLSGPQALALDPDGRLFISDVYNARIRVVDRAGESPPSAPPPPPPPPPPGPGPGPSPGPPDSSGPAIRLLNKALWLVRGRIAIRVACPAGERAGCAGALTITTAGRPRLTLGRASFRIAAGRTVTVRVRPSRRAIRRIQRLRRLTVRVVATARDQAASARTTTKTLPLRASSRSATRTRGRKSSRKSCLTRQCWSRTAALRRPYQR